MNFETILATFTNLSEFRSIKCQSQFLFIYLLFETKMVFSIIATVKDPPGVVRLPRKDGEILLKKSKQKSNNRATKRDILTSEYRNLLGNYFLELPICFLFFSIFMS